MDLEITERIQAFEEAEAALDTQIGRWNGREWFVVADSSFYIQNPDKLADVDPHKVLGLPSGEHIRLLFPIVVVDELDGLKEASKQRARWRASHTLGLLEETLAGSTFGILHRADLVSRDGEVRGEVNWRSSWTRPGMCACPSLMTKSLIGPWPYSRLPHATYGF
ncbi:PIN domain-containing protein [Streptomyces sp. NPDC001177]